MPEFNAVCPFCEKLIHLNPRMGYKFCFECRHEISDVASALRTFRENFETKGESENESSPDDFEMNGDELLFYIGSSERVTLPAGIAKLGYSAFQGCKHLKSVIIRDSVKEIADGCFAKCTSLEEMSLPFISYPKRSEGYQFGKPFGRLFGTYKDGYNRVLGMKETKQRVGVASGANFAEEIRSYNVPASLRGITVTNRRDGETVDLPPFAFESCDGLNNVLILNGGIGRLAFNNCSGLKYVSIGTKVSYVGESAFSGCGNIERLDFGGGSPSFYNGAFEACTSKTEVYVSDIAGWCKIKMGNIKSNPLWNGASLYFQGERIKELVIPEGVERISEMAFTGCASIESVTLPKSLSVIGDLAFYNCKNLKRINIPRGVAELPAGVFRGCDALEEVIFEEPRGWRAKGSLFSAPFTNAQKAAAALKKGEKIFLAYYR